MKKRGMAILLASMMAVNLCGLSAVAEEMAVEETGIMAMEETVAETVEMPDITEAPETEPPVTEAPITEAPVTEAPETEAPVTEAPVTEPPATEVPETETSETKAPETAETGTETESESETEEAGVYTWEDGELTAEVTLPETITLPENAVLKVTAEKEGSDARQNSISLVEKVEPGLYFGEYAVYDICFELDGAKLDLGSYTDGTPIGEKDIEVTLTFTDPIFSGRNVQYEMVKAYHIKDLTSEELARARAQSEEASNLTPVEEQPETEIDEQKAVELETVVEMTGDRTAVSAITFKTDGFSNYVFAVTGEDPKTPDSGSDGQEPGQIGTEETNETTESETESETEELESEIVPEIPLAGDTAEEKQKLTVYMGQIGKAENAGYVVTLTPNTAVTDLGKVTLDAGAPEGAAVTVEAGALKVTVPVTGEDRLTGITLLNLPDATYVVDAGGSVTLEDAVTGGKEYTSLYCVNGQQESGGKVFYNEPPKDKNAGTITIKSTTSTTPEGDPTDSAEQGIANQTVEIYNVYTVMNLKLVDKDSKNTIEKDSQENGFAVSSKNQSCNITLTGGEMVLTGLPIGRVTVKGNGGLTSGTFTAGSSYNWKMNTSGAPDGYVADLDKTAEFSFISGGKLMTSVDSALEAAPTKVKLQAKDTSAESIRGLTMQVKDDTTNEVWEQTYRSDETISGRFVVGHEYTITQMERPAGYVIRTASYKITIANHGNEQGTGADRHSVNKPIVVTVGNVNGKGTAISGGTLQILTADNKRVGEVIHGNWMQKVTKLNLDPEKTYYLAEATAPNGHYASEKKAEFKLDADGEATVTLKYVSTKLVFTRYAYNYITRGSDGKLVYHDRAPLAGAVLVLKDSRGSVVDRWTTGSGAYVCEGKVNVGESYTLSEEQTPSGYATPKSFAFTTQLGATQMGRTVAINENGYISPYTNVAVQATRYGSVEVAKRVAYNGEARKVSQNRTFYCGLFSDSGYTKLYKMAAINMTPSDVFGTAAFTDVAPGNYYLAETDANGNRITGQDGTEVFRATVAGNPLTVTGGVKVTGNILNNFTKLASQNELQNLSGSESNAWNDVGSSYSGTTDENGNSITAENAKTNDPTKFIPYIIMVIAALAAVAGVVVYKKKKK